MAAKQPLAYLLICFILHLFYEMKAVNAQCLLQFGCFGPWTCEDFAGNREACFDNGCEYDEQTKTCEWMM